MIRILHLITASSTGGAEIALYKLVSGMERKKFKNIVVSMRSKGAVGKRIEQAGIPVYSLNMSPPYPNPFGLLRLVALIKEQKIHIIQSWLYHADLLGLLAGKLSGAPAVVWNLRCSNMDMGKYSIVSSIVLRLLIKLSKFPDIVITNSMAGKNFHEKLRYNPKRWEIIPNGFDASLFKPNHEAKQYVRDFLGLSQDSFLIGLIARYDPVKGHRTFLEAAKFIANKFPNTFFVLIGSGVDENNMDLNGLIENLGLTKKCFLLGEKNDLQLFFPGLDIFTSSSYSEGFSNVIGEAMLCGLPCVVTDVGDSAYIVGDTGKVVPPNDPAAMARAWSSLLMMDENTLTGMGKAARMRIISRFSIDKIVGRYEAVYSGFCKELQL